MFVLQSLIKKTTHNKIFVKVPITFESNTKLLSRDINDRIIEQDDAYIKQIKSDHSAAKKLKLPVKEAIKDGTLEQLFFHSERVLLTALRKKALVQKIIANLVEKLSSNDEQFKVYGATLILYSTNSVCDNCVYSLITNQNKVGKLNTVQSIFHKSLTGHQNLILSDKHEFKFITLVRSDKPFSTQAKILYNENKACGNPKAKIYLDDDAIDLHKIFKLPNSSQILIESIEKEKVKEDISMPEEKSLAFMSGSKESKQKSKNKLQQLEKSIKSVYDDEDTSTDSNVDLLEGQGLFEHSDSRYWYIYTNIAMDQMLKLRLKSANISKEIEIGSANYVFNGTSNSVERLAEDIISAKSSNTILINLNLYNKHWVGIAIDKDDNYLNCYYMDSEQQEIPPLIKEKLVEVLTNTYSECKVNIIETEVELQKYNNCGPEVIENLMQYVTGYRLSQEDALPVHTLLFEDSVYTNLS